MPDDVTDPMPDRGAPAVPEPLAPVEGTEVDDPSVTFEWTDVPDATNYELQLAEDRAFEQIVFEGRVGAQTAFTYSGLPPQEGVSLHWRVRAADGDAFGDWGPTASFVVVDWQPKQPGTPTTTSETPAEEATAGSSDLGAVIAGVLVTVAALAIGLAYSLGDTTVSQPTSTARSVPPPDTASLDDYRVRDDGTVVIPIDSAMKMVVEERAEGSDE